MATQIDYDRRAEISLSEQFEKWYQAAWKQVNKRAAPALRDRRIMGLDPGETTGVAILDGLKKKVHLLQLDTRDIPTAYDTLVRLVGYWRIDHIRCEDYKVYDWKATDHSWGSLHTPQLIGAIKVVAHLTETPISFCMAQQAKAFVTDEKLKAWDMYERGMKHARDAQRHLIYNMFFPDKDHSS